MRAVAVLFCAFIVGSATAQQGCPGGVRVEGDVVDPSGLAVLKADVATDGQQAVKTDRRGHFDLGCVQNLPAVISVMAAGFEPTTVEVKGGMATASFVVRLAVASVNSSIDVTPDGVSGALGAGSRQLNAAEIVGLADDPDDFTRQLQSLASAGGGDPGAATVVVDGFQNASALPPKSSIASIRINPDQYTAQYEAPPYSGGRIEITTKPGLTVFHGALLFTDSESGFNATDPFAQTSTPASKRRFGAELNGPIVKKKSDFSMALEHRQIAEFNIVDAVTLGANGVGVPISQTVGAPESLWIGSVRGDLQVAPKDFANLSFAANVRDLGGQGAGGLTLAQSAYNNRSSEYDLRFVNTWIASASLLHDTRIGYTWTDYQYTPVSTAPQVTVEGYFTGGGATGGYANYRNRQLEVDDDITVTKGKHLVTAGVQSLAFFIHDVDPDTFNGSYTFGGGSAPVLDSTGAPTGQTTNITALEQYRRALAGEAGGAPTTYQATTGTALVPFTQWRFAAYAQDQVKLNSKLTVAVGLRYAFQTAPSSFNNFAPRVGIAWTPDKKQAWVIHLHGGLFQEHVEPVITEEAYRLNGTRQIQTLVYSPSYANPLNPVAGSYAVQTVERLAHSLIQGPVLQSEAGIEHMLPGKWNVQATATYAAAWGDQRRVNVNAPMVADESGTAPDPIAAAMAPRPLMPDRNIFEYQNSGHLAGGVYTASANQNSWKRLSVYASYTRFDFVTDSGRATITPQSTYSNRGEGSRPEWMPRNSAVVYVNGHLPWKIDITPIFDVSSGKPYDITTGTDSNGDGDYNDRPSFSPVAGTGIYATKFGLLSTNVVNGNVPRNFGTMPMIAELDLNVSRSFKLLPKKANDTRRIAVNVRSANLLNHTNVTAVESVVGSQAFGESVAAQAARRVEFGARLSF